MAANSACRMARSTSPAPRRLGQGRSTQQYISHCNCTPCRIQVDQESPFGPTRHDRIDVTVDCQSREMLAKGATCGGIGDDGKRVHPINCSGKRGWGWGGTDRGGLFFDAAFHQVHGAVRRLADVGSCVTKQHGLAYFLCSRTNTSRIVRPILASRLPVARLKQQSAG